MGVDFFWLYSQCIFVCLCRRLFHSFILPENMHAFFYGFYLLQLVVHGWADKDRRDGSGMRDWGFGFGFGFGLGETAPIKQD